MVRRQLNDLSKTYTIKFNVVLTYLPTEKNKHDDLTNTIYPEGIEATPKRFAIVRINKWMLQKADRVVSYVTHTVSGAAKFKEMAIKQKKTVIELSEIKNLYIQ